MEESKVGLEVKEKDMDKLSPKVRAHVQKKKDKVTQHELAPSGEMLSGNKFQVRPTRGLGFYEVYLENAGRVPNKLNGMYTSPDLAKKDIESYLKSK